VFGLFEDSLQHVGDLVLFEEFVVIQVVFTDCEVYLFADLYCELLAGVLRRTDVA
jgi:hypothetical protein